MCDAFPWSALVCVLLSMVLVSTVTLHVDRSKRRARLRTVLKLIQQNREMRSTHD